MEKLVGTNNGYQLVVKPDHPRAWKTGYVYQHVLEMEKKLGRFLQKGEVVHHKDHNKLNNHPDNLELLTQSAHAKEHSKHKVKTVVNLTCATCSKAFTRRKGNESAIKGYKNSFCSRRCNGLFCSIR